MVGSCLCRQLPGVVSPCGQGWVTAFLVFVQIGIAAERVDQSEDLFKDEGMANNAMCLTVNHAGAERTDVCRLGGKCHHIGDFGTNPWILRILISSSARKWAVRSFFVKK